MNEQDDSELEIIFLSFELSLLNLITETLELEGFTVASTRTASNTLELLERAHRRYIVLMDNYQVSEEAQTFAKTLFARPELHQHVKLVGMATRRWEELAPLDEYLHMPFSPRDFFALIDRLCASLAHGD